MYTREPLAWLYLALRRICLGSVEKSRNGREDGEVIYLRGCELPYTLYDTGDLVL
jgi:hypothetical protein